MTEEFHGLVTGVREERLGDVLTVAAVAGDTVLHVNDVADFDEDGGWFRFPGVFVPLTTTPVVLPYATVDDDACTITLTAALASSAAAPVDSTVEVYDFANSQPVTTYKAIVDSIDGFDGDPVEAVVDQGLATALAQSMRDGVGESVSLARDGSEMRLVKIHGRKLALAALQYLQGGLTTRTGEDQPGVDIVGSDSGTPGVYVYDTTGNQLSQVTADGFATDDPASPRIVISNTHDPLFDQGGLIAFYTAGASWTPGSLSAAWVAGPPNVGTVSLVGPAGPSAGHTAALGLSYIQGTGAVASLDALIINIGASATGGINIRQNTTVTGEIHSTTGGVFMDDLTGGGTTTASINGSGRVIRTPSSRRYKSNIKPLSADLARKVLDLEPVTFTLKDEAGTENRVTYPGFIAEQAAEVGLDLWVTRDADGNPDGFRYAELAAALIPIVRDQQQQIDDLAARLERLEKNEGKPA